MLSSLSEGVKVFAHDCTERAKEYLCPLCKGEVVLKKGSLKVDHFAHKSNSDCPHGKGESEEHLSAKISIFNSLSNSYSAKNLELEKVLNGVIADVFVRLNGRDLAIEVQRSNLDLEYLMHRVNTYNSLGVSQFWALLSDELNVNTMEYERVITYLTHPKSPIQKSISYMIRVCGVLKVLVDLYLVSSPYLVRLVFSSTHQLNKLRRVQQWIS